ncbi:hypothetical protein A7A09_019145 [Paracoccus methylarcula]|uniref:Nuclease-associated modular DNA-binding 1 domain-containing protein n=1 Tax=Paracoccus methylarcula TaxID=72022 RepID=A0A3R7P2F8_9RHOB|nr:hypothetical protein A7A09_019145 [Paracoccus methylarcula]
MIPVRGPDGQEYASLSAAARAFGVHITTIRRHLASHGNLDMIGCNTVPCTWNGRGYPSIRAVAKAVGLTPEAVSHHLAKYGNLDRLGIGSIGSPGNPGNSMPFRFGDLSWPSRGRAARDLGVSQKSLMRWSGPNATAQQRDKLMAAVMAYRSRQHRRAA